jgi:hypothetical protein
MAMKRTLLLLSAALLMTGTAHAARPSVDAKNQARLDKLLKGRTPGQPVSCLPVTRTSDSETIGSTIVYRVGGTYYVNRFLDGCPALRPNTTIVSNHPTGRVCRGDIAQVFMQPPTVGISTGACAFGDFTPYPKPR